MIHPTAGGIPQLRITNYALRIKKSPFGLFLHHREGGYSIYGIAHKGEGVHNVHICGERAVNVGVDHLDTGKDSLSHHSLVKDDDISDRY